MIKKLALTLLPLARNPRFLTIKNRAIRVPTFSQVKYYDNYSAISQAKNKALEETRTQSKLQTKTKPNRRLMAAPRRRQKLREN